MALTTLVAGQVIRASTLNANFALCVLTDTARTVTVTHTYTASQTFSGGWTTAAACTVTVASATALAVGRQGATNPALLVHTSTASSATGLQITAAAAAGGLALAVISSGTNENLTVDAKGSGTVTLGGTSTGAITLARATLITGNLTFTDNSFDIGASGATRPRNLFLAGNATIGGNLTMGGNVVSHLLFTDNNFDIGASGATRPRSLFLAQHLTLGGDVTAGGMISLNGAATSQSGSRLSVGNTTQTSVGAAGGASALPATPTGYIKGFLGSTQIVVPYYAQA